MQEKKTEITEVNREEDFLGNEMKNPRISRIIRLQEEVRLRNEMEKQRSRRISREREYIDQMSLPIEEDLRDTREEQQFNEEFEKRIRYDVYRMHDISEDKLTGMEEYRNAWYQGAAFALLFLSLALFLLCGLLHGFGSEICIFMAFYTAIEGTLLPNGKRQAMLFEILTRTLYLLLFPAMMVIFVCYELGFEEYRILVPAFTVAGVVVLILGVVSYFTYDPYRMDRRNRKKADHYIKEMEKAVQKEMRLKEKAVQKEMRLEEKAREKQIAAAEKKEQQAKKRQERKEKRTAFWNFVRKKKWQADREDTALTVAETELVTETAYAAETELVTETAYVAEAERDTETEHAAETERDTETEHAAEAERDTETELVAEAGKEEKTENTEVLEKEVFADNAGSEISKESNTNGSI